MSTSVVLTVTPAEPIDPDRYGGEVPDDIVAAFSALGRPARAGLVQTGREPVRLRFQLSGPDRVAASEQLSRQLTRLGYDVHVSITP